MTQKRKIGAAQAPEETTHPEQQASVKRGLPDADSSKAGKGDRQDARTGHDKDANEEQHARKGATP